MKWRKYQGEEDFWRIRAFLRRVFVMNGRREASWHVLRWDLWRWHGIGNCREYPAIDDVTFIWETGDGEIAAVLNPENRGETHLQVHPGLRTLQLEEEMLDVSEQHLAVQRLDGCRELAVHAYQGDDMREAILARRGYARGSWVEYQHRRELSNGASIPDGPIPPGYTVRSLGDAGELPARSWAYWKGFHPDEPDEKYKGWEWYRNIQCMPLYRRDLDIVAVAPSGEIASFCTFWYDDVTRSACIEPVATVREHQRRGLARAVILEGMRRVQQMGGTLVTVAGYSVPARALYESMGIRYAVNQPWVRAW
jgi:mycothiol synthase